MESTEVIIARLVLGYLRDEKCKPAYKEFLRTSTHLRDDINLAKTKYLPTRFVGLTLEDILTEYFEIYNIVQGRLESTNYYNERHSKTSLVQQLLYLLNRVLSSRVSTPCPRSPLDLNLDETSISHTDHISDVETTPAHTLPGNIRCTSEDSYLQKTPRRKPHPNLDESATEDNFPGTDKEDISEVLAQTLLENKEFHEKIAQTINKVAEKTYRVSSELDKTIKTVVRETEEDPIFDKILDEIIGSTNALENKGIGTSSSANSTAKNKNEGVDDRSKRTYTHSNSTDEYASSYRSYADYQKVEEQNNEAIRSIVANSKLGANKQADTGEGQGSNEVIVFDGSLDKYLITNTCNANTQTQPVQNSLYFNTGGLLMVPSSITNVPGNLQIDSSKQYYLVNKQPNINWNMPTISTTNITEQDILAMPTVIVNDERHRKSTFTKSTIETPAVKTVTIAPPQHIVPKPVIEIPNIEEYLMLHRSQEPRKGGLKKVIYPKAKKRKPSETEETSKASDAASPTTKTNSAGEKNGEKTLHEEPCTDAKHQPTEKDKDSNESEVTKSETQAKTPSVTAASQKTTPKSSSHVRNLDFSTPPKITSTHKKTMKSKRGKTPPFVHKKQAAAKTLFKGNKSETTADKDENVKDSIDSEQDQMAVKNLTEAWDADLRSAIPPVEEVASRSSHRKRPASTKRSKKKAVKSANAQLNTTEQDAALLEAALQTPVKTESLGTADNGTTEIKMESYVPLHRVKENICEPPGREHKKSESESENNFEAKTKKKNTEPKTKDITSKKTSDCKWKTKESPEDNHTKTILSPSKLNASKRKLVNTGGTASNLTNGLAGLTVEDAKFITPEMAKEHVNYPVKANRNITPMLDTPLKNEFIPKTPGLLTPSNPSMDFNNSICSNGFTPFTKMLEANLKGIDINSLPTPNIPITPNFPPFTPTIDLISPYSNRPTDYSTSSSYYQPSDSEQNRSLEANIMELEKKPIPVQTDVVIAQEDVLPSGSGNDKEISKQIVLQEQMIVVSESGFTAEANKNDQNKPVRATTVREHLSIFNKNVIGKKNLNLMNRNISCSSSSSDDSTSESSSNEEGLCSWLGEQSNETVILKKPPAESPKRFYSLRNRCTASNKEESASKPNNAKEPKVNNTSANKETKTNPRAKPTNRVNSKQCKSSKVVPKPEILVEEEEKEEIANIEVDKKSVEINTFQQKVLKELEEKRLRTINKFKNIEKSPSAAKPPNRLTKFIKIKPISNITNSKRKPRKSASPKKTPQNKIVNASNKAPNSKEKKDESKRSLKLRTSKDKSPEMTDKSASDVEAQNLIEGLKERGIHLVHNKSPTKKISSNSNVSKVENETTGNIDDVSSNGNLDVSKEDIAKSTSSQDDICKSNSLEISKDELSTSQLETELRESYDTRVFEEEYVHVVFDESKKITKPLEDYSNLLKKTIMGKVFIEEIDAEIEVPLGFTPFYSLLEIPTNLDSRVTEHSEDLQMTKYIGKVTQPENTTNKNVVMEKPDVDKHDTSLIRDVSNPPVYEEILNKSDDDLMNYAIAGSVREEMCERSESPKNTRKRKHCSEENLHTEKKSKTLLQNINIDSFLNNIHGGS